MDFSWQFLFSSLTIAFLLTLTVAQQQPLYHFCINDNGNFTRNSIYETNLNSSISLINTANYDSGFYNFSSGQNSSRVNAIALCRGDVGSGDCIDCITNATVELRNRCPNQKEAIIWYESCMFRYANRSIFGVMENSPSFYMWNVNNVTDVDAFNQALGTLMNRLTNSASSGYSLRKFATGTQRVSAFQTVYGLVQCTPDLTQAQCSSCLSQNIEAIPQCCDGKQGGRVIGPSCNFRFESARFYNGNSTDTPTSPSPTAAPPLSPPTSSSFVAVSCPGGIKYTPSSQFGNNLDRLLNQNLDGQGSLNGSFFNYTEGEDLDKVYGLFLCRLDVEPDNCQSCIDTARTEIKKKCPFEIEAIIWYDECLARYSNRSFFTIMDQSPLVPVINAGSGPDDLDKNEAQPAVTLLSLTTTLSNESNYMYAAKVDNVSATTNLYGRVQCTPDLSVAKCLSCLNNAIDQLKSFSGKPLGVRVLCPSCNIRYVIFPSNGLPEVEPSPTSENKSGNNGDPKWVPIVASLSTIFGLTLFCSGGVFLWRRRKRNSQENIDLDSQEVQLFELGVNDDYSSENFQGESGVRSKEFPSIQLDILLTATNHFSDENKLGQGGFGPVYKGKLPDGKEIAVKRLSRTSGQGLVEFKNEVMLIAKLQHRNLVRLLGCCLEQNEKLLVYEYMPNKSLDVFLFDSSRGVQLDWQKRLSIINGIARGILYLHEDSRLRIIHRDLKASNVLLDHEMNPKISDFGMARIFGGNQSEANTNRVVGTYGYMAPEYAMGGLFSIKSDVFSFGVLLLEIISGKRNFHLLQRGESLLTFAWKLWSQGQGMELIDPLLVRSCVANEVLKCIHIGLLCVQEDPTDRPTMSTVILMLGSETITFPLPAEPTFSVGRVIVEPPQSSSSDRVRSFNEVTISNMSPR
ncbi:hypothetical protein PTKIN_Ptkin18bG0138800 [Pterospermum kingtungense]